MRFRMSFRNTATEAFVANELEPCRRFFHRIVARPLTEEQRRAAIVD